MTWRPFPLVGGAYADESRPWSSQRCVNYLLVPAEAEGTRSRAKLVGVPGLAAFSRGMQEAPVRGLHNVEGLLLAVAGDMLYRMSPTAVAIPIGPVPGTGRVEMAHNQIQNGYEVMVANGQSGYVYNTRTQAYGQVEDEGFPGMRSPAFVDGYIAGVEPQGRFWYHSELRAATQYNTLDRYDAEALPDKIQLLRVANRTALVLGQGSGQFFRNTGAATGTFANENGTEFTVGAASRYAAEVVDSTVVWLGNDGLVYQTSGASPQIVSTGPIASAMAQYDLSTCFTMLWEDGKHKVVYFTYPQGQTFGYDLWTRAWHERQSYGMERWRVSALCRWGNRWVAGDYANGRLYWLDKDVQAEYDEPLQRRRVAASIHADENPVVVNAMRLVIDTGLPTKEPGEFPVPPIGPQLSGAAPDGSIGFLYAGYTYTSTPGDAPIVSSIIASGALPPGVTYDGETHTLSATMPTHIGGFTFTIRDTDANGLWVELTDTVRIASVSLASGWDEHSHSPYLSPSETGEVWGASTGGGGGTEMIGIDGGRFVIVKSASGSFYTDDLGGTRTAITLDDYGGAHNGDFRAGLLVIGGSAAGIWYSQNRGGTVSLVGYPAAPRTGYAAILADRVISASQYKSTLHYTTDLTTLTGWVSGAALPSVTMFGGGGAAARSESVAAFGGSNDSSKPVIVFTDDGLALLRTVNLTESTGELVVAACCGRVGDRDVWLFATDGEEVWWTDDDGETMHLADYTIGVQDITFNGDRFILVGSVGGLAYVGLSGDGTTLTEATSYPFSGNVSLVASYVP